MAQVTLEINGRPHVVGCGPGEEARLIALSRYVDTKVRELAAQVGTVGESRLLLLACLTLADELGDAYQIAEAGRRTAEGDAAADARGRSENGDLESRFAALEARLAAREAALAGELERLADRLSEVADRLAPPR
jgi:cell division protein ZapA